MWKVLSSVWWAVVGGIIAFEWASYMNTHNSSNVLEAKKLQASVKDIRDYSWNRLSNVIATNDKLIEAIKNIFEKEAEKQKNMWILTREEWFIGSLKSDISDHYNGQLRVINDELLKAYLKNWYKLSGNMYYDENCKYLWPERDDVRQIYTVDKDWTCGPIGLPTAYYLIKD